MGEFIPLFRTQSTNYDVNYRFALDSAFALRTGFNYNRVTGDDGRLELGTKIGADYSFKHFKKFSIYSGLDFNFTQQRYDVDGRSNIGWGSSVFIGFQYRPVHFLSISTEPGFYWYRRIAEDPESFDNKRSTWNEFSISNLGQLLLSFHF